MQARTSIYHKLILYIFFLGIFVIVAVSIYSFFTARNAIMQRTYEQLTSLRVAKKEQLEKFFNDRIREVELFANQQQTTQQKVKNLRPDGSKSSNAQKMDMNPNLERFFKSAGYFSKAYLIYDSRIERYSFDSLSDSSTQGEYIEKVLPDSIITKVKQGNKLVLFDFPSVAFDSTTHLYIASPVRSSPDLPIKIVIFEISLPAINQIMRNKDDTNGMGKSGEVYLVGSDSIMRSESRFYDKTRKQLLVNTESVQNAFNLLEGTQINKDYRGVLTLSSYGKISVPGLNWVIIAEIDKREAMRPVYKLANEIVFLSIFITLILFIAAYIISRNITGPIIELKNATIRVGKGDFDSLLNIKSNDELGELTENFNLMTSQLKAQQEELSKRETRMFTSFIDGQEDERQRLSRELHDGLGQMIIATKLKTETVLNNVSSVDPDNLLRLRLMFDRLVDEVRSISNNLMPAVLKEFGIAIALSQVCKDFENSSHIKVVFDSQIASGEIDKRIATYIFRIAQEAINNAVKHSGASEVIVTLIANEKMVNLLVQDDGIGINFEEPKNQNGRGLNSMRERVKLLNGIIDISKGEDHGTIVSVKIPLN